MIRAELASPVHQIYSEVKIEREVIQQYGWVEKREDQLTYM